MSHDSQCEKSYKLINMVINHNSTHNRAWINTQEILTIYEMHPPCIRCRIEPEQLSKVTGRLYKQTWDEHIKKEFPQGRNGEIIDLFS